MQAPPVAPVTEIRPDDGFRRLVRIGSAVATALAAVVVGALVAAGGPPVVGGALLGLTATPLIGSLNRGDLRLVRITASGLDLVGGDDVVRSIDGRIVGGLAISGPVVSGRLAALPIGFVPGMIGRLLVVDHRGRVVCARRAGWMREADVAALAATAGVPWGGRQPRKVPGVSAPPPPGMEGPLPGVAADDPATAAGLARFLRRSRRAALVATVWLATGIAALVLLANLPETAPGRPVLGWYGGLAIAQLLFSIPIALVQAGEARRPRRILRGAPWWPVEAVVVSGLITDQSARMVAVPRPDIGDVDVWKVTGGGGRGWLQGDDRTWFWLAVDRRGRNAVIAPPDRSELALLEKRVLAGLTSGEVRSEVLSEAAEWHHRQAWAAWAAAQQPAVR
jgi:hypothetical protein